MIAVEAGAQPAVGREANAVARPAVRVRHRRDHADRPRRAGEPMVGRGAVAARRARSMARARRARSRAAAPRRWARRAPR